MLRRAAGRLHHVDHMQRITRWTEWLERDAAPDTTSLDETDRRLLRMLLGQVLDSIGDKGLTLQDGADLLWAHPQVRGELRELLQHLASDIPHLGHPLDQPTGVPLRVHSRYARAEILAACGVGTGAKARTWREGVYYAKEIPADLFAFTLDKTKGQFSPTTRYRDYAISRELIHWESQSTTSLSSPTGARYVNHRRLGYTPLLFVRETTRLGSGLTAPFWFLGPLRYVSHRGDRPIQFTWKLDTPMPARVHRWARTAA